MKLRDAIQLEESDSTAIERVAWIRRQVSVHYPMNGIPTEIVGHLQHLAWLAEQFEQSYAILLDREAELPASQEQAA